MTRRHVREGPGMWITEDSNAVVWHHRGGLEQGPTALIDEPLAEHLVDRAELAGLEGVGRARYRASVEMTRASFPRRTFETR
jgi:hypothetical protein